MGHGGRVWEPPPSRAKCGSPDTTGNTKAQKALCSVGYTRKHYNIGQAKNILLLFMNKK